MTGSGVGAGGIGVGAGGSGVGAGVGVATGVGVGVAFTVTVMVMVFGSVLGCFDAGVGSTTFGGSMGSALEMGTRKLSPFVWGEVLWLSFSVTDFLIVDTIGLKFIPAIICSRAAVISAVVRSTFEAGSVFTVSVCGAGSECGGAVWQPLTLTKRAVVKMEVEIFFMVLILSWFFS